MFTRFSKWMFATDDHIRAYREAKADYLLELLLHKHNTLELRVVSLENCKNDKQ